MMRNTKLVSALAAVVVALSACGDSEQTAPQVQPESTEQTGLPKAIFSGGSCPSTERAAFREAEALISNELFASSSTRGQVQSTYNAMKNALTSKPADPATAEAKLYEIIDLTLAAYNTGGILASALTGDPSKLTRFLELLYCLNDKNPGDIPNLTPGGTSDLIFPDDPDKLVKSADNQAAVLVPAGAVPAAFPDGVFITVTPTTAQLNTPLDKYGPTYLIHDEPNVPAYDSQLTTGVCINTDGVPQEVIDRLRLAHELDAGVTPPFPGIGQIEILAPASTSVLGIACDPQTLAGSGFLWRVFEWVSPQPLFARAGTIGVGGKNTNLSPHAAVDPVLYTSANSLTNQSGLVGQPVASPPSVKLLTRLDNPITGRPVSFATSTAGATIAPATTTTGTGGIATATSWVLALGANTATATFGNPGSANATYPTALDVTFTPSATLTFTATGSYPPVTIGPTSGTGEFGVTFSQTFTVAGGSGSGYVLSLGGTAPSWLGVSGLTISGAPTAYGEFTFPVTATDGVGNTTTINYTLTVPRITGLTVQWTTQPARNQTCNVNFVGNPTVTVRDQAGNARPGIVVSLAAQDNNGTPAQLLPTTTQTTDSLGQVSFSSYRLTKSGGYRLVATAVVQNTSPAVTASAESNRINVAPCQ